MDLDPLAHWGRVHSTAAPTSSTKLGLGNILPVGALAMDARTEEGTYRRRGEGQGASTVLTRYLQDPHPASPRSQGTPGYPHPVASGQQVAGEALSPAGWQMLAEGGDPSWP